MAKKKKLVVKDNVDTDGASNGPLELKDEIENNSKPKKKKAYC